MNLTRQYIDELLDIYDKVCSIKPNEYIPMIEFKRAFLDIDEKIVCCNLLNGGLDPQDVAFLKRDDIVNFRDEHLYFEGLIWFYLVFGILSGIMAGRKYREYILNRVELSKLKLALTYGVSIHYAYSPEKQSRVPMKPQQLDEVEIRRQMICSKDNIKRLVRDIPHDKVLRKVAIKAIEKKLLDELRSYKQTVEEQFYDLKDQFRWYNKDIRVYIGNALGKEYYECIIKAYKSEDLRISVFPKILSVYPNMEYNIEEINEEPTFIIFSFMPRDYCMSGDVQKLPSNVSWNNQNKVFKGGYGYSALGIRTNTPYEELFSFFMITSSYDERITFIRKLINIFGYNITELEGKKGVFKLSKYSEHLFESSNTSDHKEEIVFVLNERVFLNTSDARDFLQLVKEVAASYYENGLVYTMFQGNSDALHMLMSAKIKIVDLNYIVRLVLNRGLFEYLKPVIVGSIKQMGAEHRTKAKTRTIGGELIKQITEFEENKGTWKQFEILMTKIWEFLFKDSFKHYFARIQLIDCEGLRKPDLVISNTSPNKDFWKIRKTENKAKRIIVDFKNYSDKINAKTVADVSKYLNDKKGNFAVVVSKHGFDSSGDKEQKTRYYDHDQLIIGVDVSDIVEMINAKINLEDPEDVLERKVSAII